MENKKYTVTLYDYNLRVLESGLERIGRSLDEFTDEQIGKMLSYAIGYCDFDNESVARELVEESEME